MKKLEVKKVKKKETDSESVSYISSESGHFSEEDDRMDDSIKHEMTSIDSLTSKIPKGIKK